MNKYFYIAVLILLSSFFHVGTHAQCTTPVSSFPYTEDFEASDGGWTRSSAAHWEWGQVASKPVITAAGGGTKCWVAGGLTGSSYNSGSSNLQTPCFNISSLANPQVSFKVFWETERRYDGAVFQYSTDGGLNWQILGSVNSNSNCLGENWFNYDPVNFLGSAGWSGNIQATSGSCVGGGGSGSWLVAKHSLASVTPATSVIFRFVFAAGLTCNNYDGFAIDDFRVGEAPANSAGYTYTCNANNSVTFSNYWVGCKSGVTWDFDDPASGANNTSTTDNPTHIFSSPGDYLVKLTTAYLSGPAVVASNTIHVIAATTSIIDPLKCNGDQNGTVSVSVTPPGTYNYSWNTTPPKATATITNLGSGTYTVTITGTNTCTTSVPVTLTDPSLLTLTTTITNEKCGKRDGAISTTVTGGTGPYQYTWSDLTNNTSIVNLPAGIYSLQLTDANGCTKNVAGLEVKNITNNVNISLGNKRGLCPGQSIVLQPGSFKSYKWQDNSTGSTFTVNSPGNYSVVVTDNDGCTGSAAVEITDECSEVYFPSAFTPNKDSWNETFGPLGNNLSSLRDYRLVIYGRWGEVLFTSTDPYQKWDGTYKGKPLGNGSYVWVASYTGSNLFAVTRQGSVTIIR